MVSRRPGTAWPSEGPPLARHCQERLAAKRRAARAGLRVGKALPRSGVGLAKSCQAEARRWPSAWSRGGAIRREVRPPAPTAREAAERNNNGFQRPHLDMSSTAGGPRARGETRKNHGPAVLARAWLARAAAARGVAMHRAVKALIIPICGSCICNDYRICGGGARAGAKPLVCPARPDKSQLNSARVECQCLMRCAASAVEREAAFCCSTRRRLRTRHPASPCPRPRRSRGCGPAGR